MGAEAGKWKKSRERHRESERERENKLQKVRRVIDRTKHAKSKDFGLEVGVEKP